MNFTQDYFSHNIPHLTAMLSRIPEKKRFLEIGSFEGRSTCWFLQNMDEDGTMVCIDTWQGSEEHGHLDLKQLKDRFDENVSAVVKPSQNLKTLQKTSYDGLSVLSVTMQPLQFDFIYIDGSHQAADVMTDACMAFPLLKKGGVMVFDDYLWGKELGVLHNPKIAVDAFTTIFAERCNIVGIGYQVAVQKI